MTTISPTMSDLPVRIRSWIRGSDADARTGLLGFLTLLVGDFIIDGVTVRRTAEGRHVLSYPARTDRSGRRHPYIRPIDDQARRHIEQCVLGQLANQSEVLP